MTKRLSAQTKSRVAQIAATRAVQQIRSGLTANLWQCIRPSLKVERPDVFTDEGSLLLAQDQVDELEDRTRQYIKNTLITLQRSGEWDPN